VSAALPADISKNKKKPPKASAILHSSFYILHFEAAPVSAALPADINQKPTTKNPTPPKEHE